MENGRAKEGRKGKGEKSWIRERAGDYFVALEVPKCFEILIFVISPYHHIFNQSRVAHYSYRESSDALLGKLQ